MKGLAHRSPLFQATLIGLVASFLPLVSFAVVLPVEIQLACPVSVEYNGSAQEPCTAIASDGIGFSVPLQVLYENNTNAGTARAFAVFSGDSEHSALEGQTSFSISKRFLRVSSSLSEKRYGDPDPVLPYSINGLVGDDTASTVLSGALGRDAGESVGIYGTVRGTLTTSNNYDLAFSGNIFHIVPRPITIQGDVLEKGIGSVDPPLSYTISQGALAFDDVPAGSLTRDFGEEEGSYNITQGSLGLLSDYLLTFVPGSLIIRFDQCANVDGIQSSVPEGMTLSGTNQCITVPPPASGGSGGGGGSSRTRTSSSNNIQTPSGSIGSVLGATTCRPLLSGYLRRGRTNDPSEVIKLQTFLNSEIDSSLPSTGFFGRLTEAAVRAFQQKYASEILTPWGATATGYVYKLTLWKINAIYCPSAASPKPEAR